eukprot:2226796-Amphidinium_carterae.1
MVSKQNEGNGTRKRPFGDGVLSLGGAGVGLNSVTYETNMNQRRDHGMRPWMVMGMIKERRAGQDKVPH